MLIRALFFIAALLYCGASPAQSWPGVNTSLANCTAGSTLRWMNSTVKCPGGTPSSGGTVTGNCMMGRVVFGGGAGTTGSIGCVYSAAPTCLSTGLNVTGVRIQFTSTSEVGFVRGAGLANVTVYYFCFGAE